MKQQTRIGEKTVSIVNSTGKAEHLKIYEIRHSLTSCTKVNSKWFQDLTDLRLGTTKLNENTGKRLFDINHSNIFFLD